MKIFLDTSILVDIDQGLELTINLCKELARKYRLFLSTVTVSEILTGSYLRKDFRKAVSKVKRILSQFVWVSLDGEVAEKIAQIRLSDFSGKSYRVSRRNNFGVLSLLRSGLHYHPQQTTPRSNSGSRK
ncbi:MAG: type II toxin-antitoxin system VapC family toxin [Candidatus Freyarchaeota archaeon]